MRLHDTDAATAQNTGNPVVRGFSIEGAAKTTPAKAQTAVRTALNAKLPGFDWQVAPVEGLPNWYEAVAGNADATPPALGDAYGAVYRLQTLPEVAFAEPSLLVALPDSTDQKAVAALRAGDERGLWGWGPNGRDREKITAKITDKSWHLDTLKLEEAVTIWQAKHGNKPLGEGIVVGHPDTGYTNHPKLAGKIEASLGQSFIETNKNGFDNLSGKIPIAHLPGHGTGTGSVIVGVAPGAKLLPLRVSRGVVHIDFGAVSKAIAFATAQGVDVISMSLGGPTHSRILRAAIAAAHAQGIIIVSAAGNYVREIVFPAAYAEVLCIGATNALDQLWEFGSVGKEVDIAAPGADVWHATAKAGTPVLYGEAHGDGTSFAAAGTAGIGALWLSYHGKANIVAHLNGAADLLPHAFAYLLRQTSSFPKGWKDSRGGAGVANAEALLKADLPTVDEVRAYRAELSRRSLGWLAFLSDVFTGGRGINAPRPLPAAQSELDTEDDDLLLSLTEEFVGTEDFKENGRTLPASWLMDELANAVQGDSTLRAAFGRFVGETPASTGNPHLLLTLLVWRSDPAQNNSPSLSLSPVLRDRLTARLAAHTKTMDSQHRGSLTATLPPPSRRMLRTYAFDPALQNQLDTAAINAVTLDLLWEQLKPGPVGEYLEVVDVDPASGCVYAPVDLNAPEILAQHGLSPSEGNPQFHQQMVYAVAMNTIAHFEKALGRPVFWSPVSPWRDDMPEEAARHSPESWQKETATGQKDENNRFVQHLRIYPHALREANAYYSPAKRALLFGYFPATSEVGNGDIYPGGLVFTCLSHDIIAHETTHALLDGMHTFFNEPTNDDVLAFHEALSDIVALFQHFTYSDIVRHQIASARGNLSAESLLGQLAQQFGRATGGGRAALRSYLGEYHKGVWVSKTPDPTLLADATEAHERGAILVAAVFRAFLILYNKRTGDLLRLATGGTGILPAGQIHPDLVERLAREASETANNLLAVCIRAVDYVPPVGITFGTYLRALITADYEHNAHDRRYRTAFIEAFSDWGIYPREVRTLSEESLLWRRDDNSDENNPLQRIAVNAELRSLMQNWQPGSPRQSLAESLSEAQGKINLDLRNATRTYRDAAGKLVYKPTESWIPGIDLRESFSVTNLRLLRRVGSDGVYRSEMVFEVMQSLYEDKIKENLFADKDEYELALQRARNLGIPLRGGATVIVDITTQTTKYVIYKRLWESEKRLSDRVYRQEAFLDRSRRHAMATGAASSAAPALYDLQTMYDSTCGCSDHKHNRTGNGAERFALLHRRMDEETMGSE
ncbi:MAG: S8 family serine peptidase [Armatimonadetes bacterium]|nr:S8 family serine peptidase [Armatimonadota bacterium]